MMKMHRIQGVSAAAALAALAGASQAQQPPPEVAMMSMDNVAYQGFPLRRRRVRVGGGGR